MGTGLGDDGGRENVKEEEEGGEEEDEGEAAVKRDLQRGHPAIRATKTSPTCQERAMLLPFLQESVSVCVCVCVGLSVCVCV